MRGADIFTESLVAMRHLDDFVSQIRPLIASAVLTIGDDFAERESAKVIIADA